MNYLPLILYYERKRKPKAKPVDVSSTGMPRLRHDLESWFRAAATQLADKIVAENTSAVE